MKVIYLLSLIGLMMVGCSSKDPAQTSLPGTTTVPVTETPTTQQLATKTCATGFVFSTIKNLCYRIGSLQSCSKYPSDACNQAGCAYDSGTETCMSASTTQCSDASNSAACSAIAYCTWDAGLNTCLSALSTCDNIKSEAVCNNYSCIWDPKGNKCLSYLGACDSTKDETVCNNSRSCVWVSNDSTCIPKWSSCVYASDQSSCSALTGCQWDSGKNQCLSMGGSCSSSSQTTCEASSTCTWDAGSNQCLAFWNTCSNITDKNSCLNTKTCNYSASQGCVTGIFCYWYGDC